MALVAEALPVLGEPPRRIGSETDIPAITGPHQPDEDLFISTEEEIARNNVVDVQPKEVDNSRHGKTNFDIYTMENGRQYEVITGEPKQQEVDTPIVLTTALGTSVRGHNWHSMHKFMELGYPVVLIGPEGGHANWPKSPGALKRFVQNLVSISVAETAENIHEILDATDESGLYEPGQIISTGESRAAMAGMGVMSRARKYGREVGYGDYIAPCFPESLKDAKGRLALPAQLLTQTSLLGNIPLNISPRRALHYPRTINPNPHFFLHMAATVPTLLSGQAGELAREIDTDSRMHNTLFTGDVWSKGDWQDTFSDHPYVVNTYLPGNHMAIARPQTQRARLGRLRNLRDELQANQEDMSAVNWDNVHMAGRLAVAA